MTWNVLQAGLSIAWRGSGKDRKRPKATLDNGVGVIEEAVSRPFLGMSSASPS